MYSLLYFVITVIIWAHSPCSAPNPLNGKHLYTIWANWDGNPKGLYGPEKGGAILDYLKNRFNFTYEMIRVTEDRLESSEHQKGLFAYLLDGRSDLLIAAVGLANSRLKVVDLTYPWMFGCYEFLFSVSDDMINTGALVKPFQWPVWLALAISIVCVIFVLKKTQQFVLGRLQNKSTPHRWNEINTTLYVFGNLLSQGGHLLIDRIPVRLVAGVWTLAVFVLVQAYTSTLITYELAPVNPPLVNSVHDIVENPEINLLVRIGGTLDVLIMDPNATGIFKQLQNKIHAYPQSRCKMVSECLNLLTPGSRNTFAQTGILQMDAIKEDFSKTGKCNLMIGKECFMTVGGSLALPKHSPYTDTINRGLMELQEIGLVDFWDTWFRSVPGQCTKNIHPNAAGRKSKSSSDEPKRRPLTLKNLTGTFIVLLVGFGLSFLAFLCELIVASLGSNKRSSN